MYGESWKNNKYNVVMVIMIAGFFIRCNVQNAGDVTSNKLEQDLLFFLEQIINAPFFLTIQALIIPNGKFI